MHSATHHIVKVPAYIPQNMYSSKQIVHEIMYTMKNVFSEIVISEFTYSPKHIFHESHNQWNIFSRGIRIVRKSYYSDDHYSPNQAFHESGIS